MGFSYKFIYRQDFIRNDGNIHILLRVIINREVKRHKTGVYIEQDRWDDKNQRVKGNSPIVNAQNKLLKALYAKTVNTFAILEEKSLPITHENFTKLFRSNSGKKHDFYKLWQDYIDNIDGKLAPTTVEHQVYGRRKMMKFQAELNLGQLNTSLMTNYEKYMRNTLNNDSNTIRSTIKRIHVVLNYLVSNNVIDENPIKGFMVKGEPSKRVYLTLEELASFERLRISDSLHNEERRNVYRYFLFACYTSLRYSDVKDLMYKDISFSSEKFFLNLVTQKTKEQIMVPLMKKAIDIIGSIKKGDEKVFTVYSTQKTNLILRELVSEAKIDKYISFHCSRHTFATTALNNGIAMATIQRLLGHENIKTTQIYSKLRDETLFKEMEKME